MGLRARPERRRVLRIIHDGEPVFHTRTASDGDRSLERAEVVPTAVHLGSEIRIFSRIT